MGQPARSTLIPSPEIFRSASTSPALMYLTELNNASAITLILGVDKATGNLTLPQLQGLTERQQAQFKDQFCDGDEMTDMKKLDTAVQDTMKKDSTINPSRSEERRVGK